MSCYDVMRRPGPNLIIILVGIDGLEDRLGALAAELGIHPKELAGAIQPLLAPKKAADIGSAQATGTLMNALTEGVPTAGGAAATATAGGLGLGSLVGFDEPPAEA